MFHLNYTNDQTHAIGQTVGPNRMGEFFDIVDVVYDEETNKSQATLEINRELSDEYRELFNSIQ